MHAPPADPTRSPAAPAAFAHAAAAAVHPPRLRRGWRKQAHLASQANIQEQVTGPVNGYFMALAAWESPQHPGQFVGYYKLSVDRPRSYWEVIGECKGCVPEVLPDPGSALAAARDLAALHAGNLVPASKLWDLAA